MKKTPHDGAASGPGPRAPLEASPGPGPHPALRSVGPSSAPDPARPLEESIERRRRQHARWEREGERPVALNLAMIGSLGWLIVIPTLAGIFVGRWLDRRAGSGITFTAALLVAGLAIGAGLAWQRMHRP